MKFAPVVDFGLKVTHEPFFRVISLKNWVKWGSEGSNFGFLEKRILDHSAEQELFRTYLKRSKRPSIPKDFAGIEIFLLSHGGRDPRLGTCWERAINEKIFSLQLAPSVFGSR